MNDPNYAPVCGIYCGNCDFLGKQCKGCGYVNGKPFWTAQIPSGICPIYNCCSNQKQIEHCGLCADFPCKIFLELRDPNMSDEEFQNSLIKRQEVLKRRIKIGTESWLSEAYSG
jgi:hypothetical protein